MKKQTNTNSMLKWNERSMPSSSFARVPQKSGVYVIGRVEYLRGLEIFREYAYVGETDNLQRRLKEHGPIREPKKGFRKYIVENFDQVRYWYCVLPKDYIKDQQDFLIKKLDPEFNVQHKTKGRNYGRKK